MRLDKYLKVSRLIKRRNVASEAASGNKIMVNNNIAKPSKEIRVGDIITINYFKRKFVVEVLEVSDNVKAIEADRMYKIIEGDTSGEK